MDTAARREQLMIYLADAKDKKINALYALLEEDIKESGFTLTDAHMEILEQRRMDSLSGKSVARPWPEVHDRILNKRKKA